MVHQSWRCQAGGLTGKEKHGAAGREVGGLRARCGAGSDRYGDVGGLSAGRRSLETRRAPEVGGPGAQPRHGELTDVAAGSEQSGDSGTGCGARSDRYGDVGGLSAGRRGTTRRTWRCRGTRGRAAEQEAGPSAAGLRSRGTQGLQARRPYGARGNELPCSSRKARWLPTGPSSRPQAPRPMTAVRYRCPRGTVCTFGLPLAVDHDGPRVPSGAV